MKSQMVVSMKNVSIVSSKLLVAAKSAAADPHAPNTKNQLAAAARYFISSNDTPCWVQFSFDFFMCVLN